MSYEEFEYGNLIVILASQIVNLAPADKMYLLH